MFCLKKFSRSLLSVKKSGFNYCFSFNFLNDPGSEDPECLEEISSIDENNLKKISTEHK